MLMQFSMIIFSMRKILSDLSTICGFIGICIRKSVAIFKADPTDKDFWRGGGCPIFLFL